jgi:hypothetical protein
VLEPIKFVSRTPALASPRVAARVRDDDEARVDGRDSCGARVSRRRARASVCGRACARCEHQTGIARTLDTSPFYVHNTYDTYCEDTMAMCCTLLDWADVARASAPPPHAGARRDALGRLAPRASHRRHRVSCVRARGDAARDGERRAFRARGFNCLSTARAEVRAESWRQTCRARRA